jgi:hypothetical protein
MGIRFNTVRLLAETLAQVGDVSSKSLLTLGVQDCYFTYEEILQFLQRHGVPHGLLDDDEVQTTTGFKWTQGSEREKYQGCIHQNTFFRLIGFQPGNIRSLDASTYEGADIMHDLNEPVNGTLCSRFDVIFDGGTIHYVFSVKDALFNVARMCRVGGVIINFNPIDYSDAGFIGLNADLFRDFYLANGFEELALKYVAIPTHPRRINEHYLELNADSSRYSFQPYYTTAVYSAFRKVEEKALKVPLQGLYERIHANDQPRTSSPRSWARRTLSFLVREGVDAHFIPALVGRGLMGIRQAQKVNL